MTRQPRGVWQSFLLLPMFVYLLLPFFGSVWHDVVPEHDHLYLGQAPAPDGAKSEPHADVAPGACDACATLIPFRTELHAFNPASALQVFGIALSLSASLVLVLPRGLSMRVVQPTLFLRAARLAPLDPPPTAARFSA